MVRIEPPVAPANLYRYRSLTHRPNSLASEIRSIREAYLYCSNFRTMNDPMEGFYDPTVGLRGVEDYEHVVRRIYDAKSYHGIACFSETNSNELMWAHYADNYAGICVRYKTQALLDGLSNDVCVARVNYGDVPPPVDHDDAMDSRSAAIKILSHKKAAWAYEREWRVLGNIKRTSYDDHHAVDAIYFGSRIDDEHRDRILDELANMRIDFFNMTVRGYQHLFEPLDAHPPRRRRADERA
ncbi:DUF2971 domain-containing protein [Rhodopseudomonas palustris]|uniref:DUF2971 domain-containing protein n=1 Tax=Rhodopseudomonas palustris TaxID=1076 RepID=UPI00163DC067|nr:DUF2971 domain-containing protein [Rhodopseudomonas palustris]